MLLKGVGELPGRAEIRQGTRCLSGICHGWGEDNERRTTGSGLSGIGKEREGKSSMVNRKTEKIHCVKGKKERPTKT